MRKRPSIKRPRPRSLGAQRVARTENSLDWSPMDLVRETLGEWEADPDGAPQKALLVTVKEIGGAWQIRWRSAGLTFAEHVALLVIGQHERMSDCDG